MHGASNHVKPPAHRVAVIGRAGAGKTTLAVRLGETLDLPVIHLDRLFWEPGWRPQPPEVFDRLQGAAVAEDRWVIDGGYLSSAGWHERIRRADVVVLVEAPLIACLWRVVRRSLSTSRARRPDLPDGCSEQFNFYFLWWTLTWGRRHRRLRAEIQEVNPGVRVETTKSDPGMTNLIGR